MQKTAIAVDFALPMADWPQATTYSTKNTLARGDDTTPLIAIRHKLNAMHVIRCDR